MVSTQAITKGLMMLKTTIRDFEILPAKRDQNDVMIAPGTVEGWSFALDELSDADFMTGIKGLMANWTDEFKRKPMPGDVLKFINKHTAINHGQMFDEIMSNAYKAMYGEFNRKTGRVEHYQFNQLISAAIKQMGGLSVFLTMDQGSLNTFRAQFRGVVNAINEKEANKAIIKPVLDSRAAIEAQARPVMIAAAEPEAEVLISEAKDPRVLSAFADLRDRMMANSKAMSEKNVQRSLDALAHMQVAMEAAE